MTSANDRKRSVAADEIEVAMSQFGQVKDTLTKEHHGTGIGLPAAKSLVEHHGGTLSLEIELGAGTVVTVDFQPGPTIRSQPGPRLPHEELSGPV